MTPMWNEVASALAEEFAGGADVARWTQLAVRLGLAVALGAAIGYERERHDKAAGLRTHMLVALGGALFVVAAEQAGLSGEGLSRVIQGVVAGVGFLGAGTVIKDRGDADVHGLTTAAGIWATAAIGVAAGLGREALAIASTTLVLVILGLLLRLERRLPGERHRRDRADRG